MNKISKITHVLVIVLGKDYICFMREQFGFNLEFIVCTLANRMDADNITPQSIIEEMTRLVEER